MTKFPRIIGLLSTVILCNLISCTPTPSAISSETTKPTFSEKTTTNTSATEKPAATASQELDPLLTDMVSNLRKMSAGEYVLYMPMTGPDASFFAISLKDKKSILLLEPQGFLDMSSDGKTLAYSSSNDSKIIVISLGDKQPFAVPTNPNCNDLSVSSDGQWLACGKNEIYVISKHDQQWQKLTYWSKSKPGDSWDYPRWSPDNKWIAFFNLDDFPYGKEDGLYLTDASCLSSLDSCKEKTLGPVFRETSAPAGATSGLAWSPDGKTLLLPGHNELFFFNVSRQTTNKITIDDTAYTISWSPSGNLLAYSSSNDGNIYLIAPNGQGKTLLVNNALVIGWIAIP